MFNKNMGQKEVWYFVVMNNIFDNNDGLLHDMMCPEGTTIREILLPNPYTGEIYRIAEISSVRYDPATQSPVCHTQYAFPVGIDGVPITEIRELSFCAESGMPVSLAGSVRDPFCGRIISLPASRMIEWNGMILRVCHGCADSIEKAEKMARRREFIRQLLFGR